MAPRISAMLRENRAVRVAVGAAVIGAMIGGAIVWIAASGQEPVATLQPMLPAAAGVAREVGEHVVANNAAATASAAAKGAAPVSARGSKPAAAAREAPPARPAAQAAAAKPIPPPPRSATFGHVTVASKVVGQVFVNGTLFGPVNKRLEIPCGAWFMRIGIAEQDGSAHHFLGEGRTVVVECGAKNQLVRNLGPGTASATKAKPRKPSSARRRPAK
jgi:hypothetical protein